MTALIDSGFFYATHDRRDGNHSRVIHALSGLDDSLVLPTGVLVEVGYLLQARIGHHAMRDMIDRLKNGPIPLQPLFQADLERISEILSEYADGKLDFVDAAITAMAERLNIRKILTVDQRGFRMIRPKHCDYFEIFP